MANLGTVSSTIIERLFVEFAEQISSTGSLVGTYESTERLLMKVLDNDKVNQIMEDIRGPAGRTMWDKLANVNETVLANYLKNEYPQTVAVVLSKIKGEHAACVLAQLPESFAMEVVMRMLRMERCRRKCSTTSSARCAPSSCRTRPHQPPRRPRDDGGNLQQSGPQHRKPLPGGIKSATATAPSASRP